MNPDLNRLQPYPFEKLNSLKTTVTPPEHLPHIALSIGEPKHQSPDFVKQSLQHNMDKLAKYPSTKGLPELSATIGQWLTRRFKLAPDSIDPQRHILPVNGTREAIFSFAQAAIDKTTDDNPLIVTPNPFYQIYEGAAFLAGAEPYFLPCLQEHNFIPDFDAVADDIGSAASYYFSAHRATPPAQCLTATPCTNSLPLPISMILLLPAMNVTPNCILMNNNHLSVCYRPVVKWAGMIINAASFFTACRNAQTCLDCARLYRRRRRYPETLFALPHLSRLRHADSTPISQHCRMVRRATC